MCLKAYQGLFVGLVLKLNFKLGIHLIFCVRTKLAEGGRSENDSGESGYGSCNKDADPLWLKRSLENQPNWRT